MKAGWSVALGLATALIATLVPGMGVEPVAARPPLDLVTGEQSVPALKEDGLIYMQWGFHSLAIDSFRAAMALEDKANTLPEQRDPDVPFSLGVLYFNTGDLRGARKAFERSLAADPTNFKVHYQLGLVELQMGDEESARQRLSLLEAASDADPQLQEHLQGLMASLDPLPVPQSEQPVVDEPETGEPELSTEDLDPSEDLNAEDLSEAFNANTPDGGDLDAETSAEPSTLATELAGDTPDLFSDEVTGVIEFDSEDGDIEVDEATEELESESTPSGLSRFRRDD